MISKKSVYLNRHIWIDVKTKKVNTSKVITRLVTRIIPCAMIKIIEKFLLHLGNNLHVV